ncbi:hypothetical protein THAOC_31205 [Thalassiosira oceanica]|uniref:Uncharacterized protein n=1 Tax=Thalassiosira oceanica TaxID=159749 RepID=K0R8M3_THAOC|nr:hypothetical protein THAOC_31205 [Thalassiosira oceanica]|eukprot:EJK49878.1 hypothetical protein THAOC_31205 [Thalassiosira oceanica]
MAGPESEDQTPVLDGLLVAEPVAHDGGSCDGMEIFGSSSLSPNQDPNELTDGPTGALEETEEEVDSNDEEVSKGQRQREEVEPERDVDHEKTSAATEETDGEDRGRIERVAQLARDDIARGVRSHEDGVHLGQDEGVVSRDGLELLLDGRVALAGEVGHEVAPERDEEGICLAFVRGCMS